MKKMLTTAAAILAVPSAAFAQAGPTSTATADASAEVVAPLQVQCNTMHFGQLAPRDTPTYVVLPPQGTPLEDPYDIVVPGTRTTSTPGNCNVTGEANLSFNVSLSTSTTIDHGGDSMVLDTFTISEEVDSNPYNRLLEDLGGVGTNGFGVGATLHVGANQPEGLYTGTYVVTVQYD